MRLIGGLLVVTAFFLIGTASAQEIRTELRTLEALLAFLRELSRKLAWSRTPLQAVFAAYRDPFLERIGFMRILQSADPKQYALAWQNALARLPLSEESQKPLRELGQSIGRVSLQTQTEQLSLCIASLEDIHIALQAKAKDKQRSAVSLWTLSGLLIALLLI